MDGPRDYLQHWEMIDFQLPFRWYQIPRISRGGQYLSAAWALGKWTLEGLQWRESHLARSRMGDLRAVFWRFKLPRRWVEIGDSVDMTWHDPELTRRGPRMILTRLAKRKRRPRDRHGFWWFSWPEDSWRYICNPLIWLQYYTLNQLITHKNMLYGCT